MFDTILRGFGFLMVFVYLATGVFVISSPENFNNIPPLLRILLGTLICVYGLFRIYKLYRSYKDEQEDEEESEQ